MIRILGELLGCVALGLFIAFAVMGWVYQCGETYVDAKGVRHVVECRPLWGGEEEQEESKR